MQINFRFKGGRKVSPIIQGNAISPPTVIVAKENTSSKTACNLCGALKYARIPAFTLLSTCCRALPPFLLYTLWARVRIHSWPGTLPCSINWKTDLLVSVPYLPLPSFGFFFSGSEFRPDTYWIVGKQYVVVIHLLMCKLERLVLSYTAILPFKRECRYKAYARESLKCFLHLS